MEQVADLCIGKHLLLGTVAAEPAVLHQDNAGYLRDNVREVVGHEDDAGTGPCDLPQGLTERMERVEVEAVGRFVKDEGLGVVDKGPPDEQTPGLA